MDIDTLTTRHLTRAFDPERIIPDETLTRLLEFLRSVPSSVNIQPWHAHILASDHAKKRLADNLGVGFADGNGDKVRNASHVLIIATRAELPASHLDDVFAQENADKRFPDPQSQDMWQQMVRDFLQLRTYGYKDLTHWLEKQTYLAVGMTMMAAVELGVDATPLEGFDPRSVDAEFDVRESGYATTVLLALGYPEEAKTQIGAPSRLDWNKLFTFA